MDTIQNVLARKLRFINEIKTDKVSFFSLLFFFPKKSIIHISKKIKNKIKKECD